MTRKSMIKISASQRHWAHVLSGVSLLFLLVAGQAGATVTVDQSPLVVQQTLAPDIVLMLDDSGSMAWDYMPDSNYMTDPSGNGHPTDDDYRAYKINGTYYNPSVTYDPPPKADSTSTTPDYFPDSNTSPTSSNPAFPNAYPDGFNSADTNPSNLTTVNITEYVGSYPYYQNLCFQTSDSSCPDGSTLVTSSTQTDNHHNPICQGPTTYSSSQTTCSMPAFSFNGDYSSVPTCPSGSTWNSTISACVVSSQAAYDPPQCRNRYSWNGTTCVSNRNSNRTSQPIYCPTGDTLVSGYCYSTVPASGSYIAYYVTDDLTSGYSTAATDACNANGPNCYTASDSSGSVSPSGIQAGQNIVNWFTYYHTRILMAKSGLMAALSDLDPTYRFGFGSINGNNVNTTTSGTHAGAKSIEDLASEGFITNTSSFSTSTNSNNKLAGVEEFGNGQDNKQKENFWTWLQYETAGSSTPLRQSLNAVGQYYETDQPWQSTDSEGTTQEYACRGAYTILTTDGFWNGGSPNVGNVDNTSGPSISGPNAQSYQYSPAAPYMDSDSDTLADVAMYYWDHDLMSGITNEVPTSSQDPAFWQHMDTFTAGLGWDPTSLFSPTGTTVDQIFQWADGGTSITGFTWPSPSSNSINNIADLAHAGVNGHGGFYSIKSTQDFINGISDALKRISARTGTSASLAANSTKLTTGTMVFQATYTSGTWEGDLQAYSVDSSTGAIAQTPTWSAAQQLPSSQTEAAARNIWIYNGSAMVEFDTNDLGSLSSAEQTALGTDTTSQDQMIDYLRGDPTHDQLNVGGSYRHRSTPLGDIVNSQPVYVGAPDPNLFAGETFSGASDYSTFASGNAATRATEVYVAANDGMLHEFDATNGSETFAYLPSAVLTNGLTTLSDPNYGAGSTPHQYYNDGQLTVADIYAGGSWKTVLVGTTGRGPAEAVYALDVTDPTNPSLLWERSAGDGKTNSGYIGQMVGKPVVALLPDGQWEALIGNGYNSVQNKAALLEFALTDSTGAVDNSGTLSVIATGDSNDGLAAPATWINDLTNGESTEAFAGDLSGNVYEFNLSDNSTTKLFTAKDSSGNVQPITAGMLVGKDPNTGKVWVFFGTGKWLTSADLSDMSTQTWYGLIVEDQNGTLNTISGRSALTQRSIVAQQAATSSTPALRAFDTATTLSASGTSGWYIDLVYNSTQEGERMVTPNQFQGNYLVGTSRLPQVSDICNPAGSGWIMAVDPFTGSNPGSDFFYSNGGTAYTITSGGKTYYVGGIGFNSLPNNPIFVDNSMLVSFSNATNTSVQTNASGNTLSQISWRELINE